jgi:hypothetical protein
MHREKRGHSGTIERSQEGRRTRYKTTWRKKSKRGRTRKAWMSRQHNEGACKGHTRWWGWEKGGNASRGEGMSEGQDSREANGKGAGTLTSNKETKKRDRDDNPNEF